MTCPTAPELVALAVHDEAVDELTVRHVAGCEACRAAIAAFRDDMGLLFAAQRTVSATADVRECVTDFDLAAIAGDGIRNARADAVAHLGSCARCRARLTGALHVLRSSEVAAEIARLERMEVPVRREASRRGKHALIAAAVLILLAPAAVLLQKNTAHQLPPQASRETDPAITLAAPPSVVSPRGDISTAVPFVWTSVAGASRYTLTLYDGTGAVVWQTETTDSTATLPAAISPAAGRTYFWKIAAHTGLNRSAESELGEFTITPDARNSRAK